MKTLMTMVMLASAMSLAGDGSGKGTADWIRVAGPTLEGKMVTLNVACLTGRRTADSADVIEGYTMIWAYTGYRGQGGGWIEVAVRTERVKSLLRRYGTEFSYTAGSRLFRTRTLRGVLAKGVSEKNKPVYYIKMLAPKSRRR